MVSPLASKPTNSRVDDWLTEIAADANRNPHMNEQRLYVGGDPALRVGYHSKDCEMEEVYVVSGSKTFSIQFSGDASNTSLKRLANYSVFNKMVDSFRVGHPR
jgi:hypothetical protein